MISIGEIRGERVGRRLDVVNLGDVIEVGAELLGRQRRLGRVLTVLDAEYRRLAEHLTRGGGGGIDTVSEQEVGSFTKSGFLLSSDLAEEELNFLANQLIFKENQCQERLSTTE